MTRFYESPVIDSRVDRLDFSHVLPKRDHDDLESPSVVPITEQSAHEIRLQMAQRVSYAKSEICVLKDLLDLILVVPTTGTSLPLKTAVQPISKEQNSMPCILLKALGKLPLISEDAFALQYRETLLGLLFRQSQLSRIAQKCRQDALLLKETLQRQHGKFSFIMEHLKLNPKRQGLIYKEWSLLDFLFTKVTAITEPGQLLEILEARERQFEDTNIYQILISESVLPKSLEYFYQHQIHFEVLQNGFTLLTPSTWNFTLDFKLSGNCIFEQRFSFDQLVVTATSVPDDDLQSRNMSKEKLDSNKLTLALRYLFYKRTRMVSQFKHQRRDPSSLTSIPEQEQQPLLVEFLEFIKHNNSLLLNTL